jgi:hypothetical protein
MPAGDPYLGVHTVQESRGKCQGLQAGTTQKRASTELSRPLGHQSPVAFSLALIRIYLPIYHNLGSFHTFFHIGLPESNRSARKRYYKERYSHKTVLVQNNIYTSQNGIATDRK